MYSACRAHRIVREIYVIILSSSRRRRRSRRESYSSHCRVCRSFTVSHWQFRTTRQTVPWNGGFLARAAVHMALLSYYAMLCTRWYEKHTPRHTVYLLQYATIIWFLEFRRAFELLIHWFEQISLSIPLSHSAFVCCNLSESLTIFLL